jgi:hypothetical protein
MTIEANPGSEPLVGFVHELGEHLLDSYMHADRAVVYLGATEVLDTLAVDVEECTGPVLERVVNVQWSQPLDQPLASPLARLSEGLSSLYNIATRMQERISTAHDERLASWLLSVVFSASVTCLTWGGDVR